MTSLTNLPGFVEKWLATLGIVADDFLGFWNEKAAQAELSESWRADVEGWIVKNVTTGLSETVAEKIAGAVVEYLSGAPGYNPNHGGLA